MSEQQSYIERMPRVLGLAIPILRQRLPVDSTWVLRNHASSDPGYGAPYRTLEVVEGDIVWESSWDFAGNEKMRRTIRAEAINELGGIRGGNILLGAIGWMYRYTGPEAKPSRSGPMTLSTTEVMRISQKGGVRSRSGLHYSNYMND